MVRATSAAPPAANLLQLHNDDGFFGYGLPKHRITSFKEAACCAYRRLSNSSGYRMDGWRGTRRMICEQAFSEPSASS